MNGKQKRADQPTQRVGVLPGETLRTVMLQAEALSRAGVDASQPMRVLWRVKPSGERSVWLASARQPVPAHLRAFYRRPTLLDCLLGEVRV